MFTAPRFCRIHIHLLIFYHYREYGNFLNFFNFPNFFHVKFLHIRNIWIMIILKHSYIHLYKRSYRCLKCVFCQPRCLCPADLTRSKTLLKWILYSRHFHNIKLMSTSIFPTVFVLGELVCKSGQQDFNIISIIHWLLFSFVPKSVIFICCLFSDVHQVGIVNSKSKIR